MYDIRLTEASFPPQTDAELRDITVGKLLRETAGRYPDATAMVDVSIDGVVGQEWSYRDLLRTSERLAVGLAACCMGTKYSPVVIHGVRLRVDGRGTCHSEPVVPGKRTAICARTIRCSGTIFGRKLSRQSDGGHRAPSH